MSNLFTTAARFMLIQRLSEITELSKAEVANINRRKFVIGDGSEDGIDYDIDGFEKVLQRNLAGKEWNFPELDIAIKHGQETGEWASFVNIGLLKHDFSKDDLSDLFSCISYQSLRKNLEAVGGFYPQKNIKKEILKKLDEDADYKELIQNILKRELNNYRILSLAELLYARAMNYVVLLENDLTLDDAELLEWSYPDTSFIPRNNEKPYDEKVIALLEKNITIPIKPVFPGQITSAQIKTPKKKAKLSSSKLKKLINDVKLSGHFISSVPEEYRTEEICTIAFQKSGMSVLKYIPDHAKTPALCKMVVEKNGNWIRWVPENMRTPELMDIAIRFGAHIPDLIPAEKISTDFYLAMVSRNGYTLKEVPPEARTDEIIKAALNSVGAALEVIPAKQRTEEFCRIALENDRRAWKFVPVKLKPALQSILIDNHSLGLRYIPESERTKEQCESAVEKMGLALEYVPAALRTEEMCVKAIKGIGNMSVNSAYNLCKFIPEKLLKTEKICNALMDLNIPPIASIDKNFLSEDACLRAVKADSYWLRYVPAQLRTLPIMQGAFEQNAESLKYLPAKLQTDEIIFDFIKQNASALAFIPEKCKTEAICKLAIDADPRALEFVPDAFKKEELCSAAIKKDGAVLAFVPSKYKTLEFCLEAVKNDGNALHSVPKAFHSEELYEIAVRTNGEALYHVPRKHRTKELCEIAMANNGYAISSVPKEYITEKMCEQALEWDNGLIVHVPRNLRKKFIDA